MMSKNNAPNKAQKDWMEAVRELGSVISGGPAVVHHCIGRSAKIKGVGNIGHWFIIPLTDEEHRSLHAGKPIDMGPFRGDNGIDYPYICGRREFEKLMFERIACDDSPVPDDVYNAIQAYHK